MSKFISIGQAAKLLGVATSTLRRWEDEGRLVPAQRTQGGQRRYSLTALQPEIIHHSDSKKMTIGYARVSSHDQKADLVRQKELLEMYCAANGWSFSIIEDLGSGMNYHKRGLKKLIQLILDREIGRLVLTHRDRLLRFGAELIFSLCEAKKIEVVIINKSDEGNFEEDLAKDVLEIITVFSARLYGSRSKKNRQLMEKLQAVVIDADFS